MLNYFKAANGSKIADQLLKWGNYTGLSRWTQCKVRVLKAEVESRRGVSFRVM